MPLEHIVWLDGDHLRHHTVTTDKIRPTRFGLIVIDGGGPVSIAFEHLRRRENVYIGRASVTYPYGIQGKDHLESTTVGIAA